MKPVIALLARGGSALHPVASISVIVGLTVQWVFTLQAIGAQFERSAGLPLLDLQNVQGVLSPESAQELISGYSESDITLYWIFFAMDNVVPLLSFGSFALLWGFLLLRSRLPIGQRLARSWLMLLPFGVGGFDIIENLFFVTALSTSDGDAQLLLLTWGLGFVQAKAAVLISIQVVSGALLILYTVGRVRTYRSAGVLAGAK